MDISILNGKTIKKIISMTDKVYTNCSWLRISCTDATVYDIITSVADVGIPIQVLEVPTSWFPKDEGD